MTAATLTGKQVPSINVVDVDQDGGELHGLGQPFDAFACGREFFYAEICPDTPETGELDDSLFGFLSQPFAVAGRQLFPVRCTPESAADALVQAFDDAIEYQIGQVLWFGNYGGGSGDISDSRLYLTSTEVETTAIGAGEVAKKNVADVLFDAFEAHPDLNPILHLGLHAALTAGQDLDVLGVPYVVNPAYPINGVAVTGPIQIYIGSVQNLSHVDWPRNRRYAEATRLGRIAFDPCLARLGTTS